MALDQSHMDAQRGSGARRHQARRPGTDHQQVVDRQRLRAAPAHWADVGQALGVLRAERGHGGRDGGKGGRRHGDPMAQR